MRRALALVVLLNVAFLSSGMTLMQRGASCCCAMKKGATCPLRKHCTTVKPCSASQVAKAIIGPRAPRVVVEGALSFHTPVVVQQFLAPCGLARSVAPAAPEPPPPRSA